MTDPDESFLYEISAHAQDNIQKRNLLLRWIQDAVEHPDKTEPDETDEELQIAFKKIQDANDKILKVVYNKTVSPIRIVTAHFDRRMKGKL